MANLIFESELHHNADRVSVRLGVLLFQDDDVYVSYCPALDLSAFGNTEDEAKKEFEDVLRIYINYCLNKKTLADDLRSHGWTMKSKRKLRAPSDDQMLEINDTYKDIKANKQYKVIEREMVIPAV